MRAPSATLDLWRDDSQLASFATLTQDVAGCQLCARMECSARVLGLSSGPLTAPIMFIGEAPGRLGADETGIPFHGDRAGFNFEDFLSAAGISRRDIFVTNAVLCNPKGENGKNASPTPAEISNCLDHLRRQIELINPKIVVTLGAVALTATDLLDRHGLTLRASVKSAHKWHGRLLIPLYHPGQRALVHRSFANQRQDYQFVADTLRSISVTPRYVTGRPRSSLQTTVKRILDELGEMSYFSLHKIVYLLEYRYWLKYGKRLTGAYFIRQKDGPYCPELHYKRLQTIPGLVATSKRQKLFVSLVPTGLFSDDPIVSDQLDTAFIEQVLNSLHGVSDSELKTKTYLTKPMRQILRIEAKSRNNLNNLPIDFPSTEP